MQPLIAINNLSVTFGKKKVFENLNLELFAGDCYALIGANGSGKTTLLQIIAGIIRTHDHAITRHHTTIGYAPDSALAASFLSVQDFLWYHAQLTGATAADAEKLLDDLLLQEFKRQICSELSRGTLKRVMIAQALIGSPQLLLLDEPFSGLDDAAQEAVINVLSGVPQSSSILYATHQKLLPGTTHIVEIDDMK